MTRTIAVHILARLQRTTRGRSAIANIFEMWVALAGIIGGLVFFYDPASLDGNALSRIIGYDLSATTSVGYLCAGLCVWWGLLRPAPQWEIAGLWLIGSATAVNGIAILFVFGLHGVATASTLLSLMVAAWARALVVQEVAHDLAGHAAQASLGGDDGGDR